MEPETFLGNALNGVDGKGRLSVPSFVRSQIDRSSDARVVMIGVHETKPCLTVYGAQYAAFMLADYERRLLRVEESGGDLDEMRDRAAGMFGNTERLSYDSSGRIVLPAKLRGRARVEDLALFVGMHRYAELWNPHALLEHGGEQMRQIAADALRDRGAGA